ncbi:hypothetical protein C2W62_01260 [Candidatus Entotheonella serta]|nr:hypothetical protein C2W62_01260 [Candidatus Entotheonella serta]
MAPRIEGGHRLIARGVQFLAFLGGLALVWLMGLTVVAVIMRYVFSAPILGAQDLANRASGTRCRRLWRGHESH